MFSFVADPARRLVTINFDQVFWDLPTLERFREERAAAVEALGCPPGTHRVLVDLRRAIIQSQEVIVGGQMIVGQSNAARIALVAHNALARMQTKRLQVRDNVLLFADIAEAKAWLLDEDDEAQHAA